MITECDNKYYFSDCSGVCGRCKNAERCHNITGHCSHGCQPNWQEPLCQGNPICLIDVFVSKHIYTHMKVMSQYCWKNIDGTWNKLTIIHIYPHICIAYMCPYMRIYCIRWYIHLINIFSSGVQLSLRAAAVSSTFCKHPQYLLRCQTSIIQE